ncbi:MAG: hypothetical protein R2771_05850 [Saprospiraceae bacterium]
MSEWKKFTELDLKVNNIPIDSENLDNFSPNNDIENKVKSFLTEWFNDNENIYLKTSVPPNTKDYKIKKRLLGIQCKKHN